MHLPGRSPRIEWSADHVGRELFQFAAPAGGGQPGPMEMLIEVELRILRPTGTMQQRGNFDESSAKLRNQVEALSLIHI